MKKKTPMVGVKTQEQPTYQDSGFCSFCLLTLESLQPGGTKVRHKSNQIPYGQCAQALAAKAKA